MTLPRISIITPSFNQGQFLEKTILSVIAQNYINLEHIIIDGGSNDNSIEVIRKYENYISYWVSEKDNGQSDAIIKGIKIAQGDILCWLNSDDWLADNALSNIANLFASNSKIEVVNGDCILTDANEDKIQFLISGKVTKKRLLRYWIPGAIPPQPSVFFKKSLYNSCSGINSGFNYTMDYDLWLQFVSRTDFYYLPEVLSYYRVHETSKTGSDNGFKKFLPECDIVFRANLVKEPLFIQQLYLLRHSLFKKLKRRSKLQNLFIRFVYKCVNSF